MYAIFKGAAHLFTYKRMTKQNLVTWVVFLVDLGFGAVFLFTYEKDA